MNDSMHIHRLSLPWWFGNILFGAFLLFIVVRTVVFNAVNIFSDINGFVMFMILVVAMLPFSLTLLARPFLTRMIVKPEGIEYHSTFFVLQAEWKNLINIGYVRKTNAGKTLVVVPRAGKLIHRKWAKPFRNLLREYPNTLHDIEILVSQLVSMMDIHLRQIFLST